MALHRHQAPLAGTRVGTRDTKELEEEAEKPAAWEEQGRLGWS